MCSKKSSVLRFVVVSCLLADVSLCFAIDNPDAPDVIGSFEARSEKFERAIHEQARDQSAIIKAYAQYGEFLDQELNQAYTKLSEQLGDAGKQSLQRSQRIWIQFRDAEYGFIDNNWTLSDFGSSSVISRGAYRTSILKNRVLDLLSYLKNYRDVER